MEWTRLQDYMREGHVRKFVAYLIAPIVSEAYDFSEDNAVDFTMSTRWILQTQVLAQGRATSYLPEAVKQRKREEFRATIARQPVILTRLEVNREQVLIMKELAESGLVRDQLENLDVAEYARAEETVRQTASVEDQLIDGGKIETARRYLAMAKKNKWLVEVYDLFTGKPTGQYVITGQRGDHQKDLFWISIGVILRYYAKEKSREAYQEYPEWRGLDLSLVFHAAIVHVSEQAKERNLVKTSAVLTWLFAPGSKILAEYLAKDPTHKTGLTGSSDAWNLDKRLSPFSEESGFIYGTKEKSATNPNVISVELDLVESTDHATRARAIAQMAALMNYSGFPHWYGKLILKTYHREMVVTEVLTADEGFVSVKRGTYRGMIREGCMMGLEPTKVMLHLAHVRAMSTARLLLLQKSNITIAKGKSGKTSGLEKDLIGYPQNPQVSRA